MSNNDKIDIDIRKFPKSPNQDTVIVIPTININKTDTNTPTSTTSPNIPPKQKSAVQFPPQLEEHFYSKYRHEKDNDDESAKSSSKLLDYLHARLRIDDLRKFLHVRFPSRIVRRVLKCTIAYFLTTLFSLVRPLSTSIGAAPFLTTTGMLFSHPGRTMGSQIDTTITAVMGVIAAVLYAFAGMASSVAYNNNHLDTYIDTPNGRIINAFFLFVGIFAAQSLREVYQKFHFFSLQFMIIQIFTMTRGIDYLTVDFKLPLNYGIPLIIGHGISLLVNLVCWPETAMDGLGRALKETITSSRDMLKLVTDQFSLEENEIVPDSVINEAAEKIRKGMTKVKTAYHEAKYEMSYTYIRPQHLGEIKKSLGRLTKHLSILGGCVKPERELFASVATTILAEKRETDTEDDDDHDDPRRPASRHSYNEDDWNLLRTALRATNELANGPFTTLHPSTNSTPVSSKPASRRTSAHNSEDEDSDHHQLSVSSIKSFFKNAISSTKPQPPKKTKRRTEYSHRHLLNMYIESLKGPLLDLSMDCANTLECVCDGIAFELNMDQDDDVSVRDDWKSYLRHIFKIGTNAKERVNLERHNGSTQCNCSQSIRLAIEKFDKAEHERLRSINQMKGNELDLGMRPELFLVSFFIFTLREIAHELQQMAMHMDEIRLMSRKSDFNGRRKKKWYVPGMNWKMWQKWLHSNNHQSTRDKGGFTFAALTNYIPKEEPSTQETTEKDDEANLTKIQTNTSMKRTQSRRESTKPISRESDDSASPEMFRRRKRHSNYATSTDNYIPEKKKKEVTKTERTFMEKINHIRYVTWRKFKYFEGYNFKCAFKMATAVLVLCIPAFVPASNTWYTNTRGQWAPLTVIAIMGPTSGGTLQASFWRIVGTLIGAFTGWAALAAGDGSPYLLGIFAVILALIFFYIHLASPYNKVGIVTLTTYMVVALSRYANPPPNETIAATVWKRTITLIVGICVALLLNSLIWPFNARHMTRKSIAAVLEQLENYYVFLMGTFLYHNPQMVPSDADKAKGEKMENKIQSAISQCTNLLNLTDHEPRFQGPFPKKFYSEIIITMRDILDRMLSTRIALIQMPPNVKRNICAKAYHIYRRDMIASMLLCLHTLGCSLRCKAKLPVYIPSARAAREKLIDQRRALSKKSNWARWHNLTWFAMACSSEEIIHHLEYLSNLVCYIVEGSAYSELAEQIDQFVEVHDPEKDVYEIYVENTKLTSLYTITTLDKDVLR